MVKEIKILIWYDTQFPRIFELINGAKEINHFAEIKEMFQSGRYNHELVEDEDIFWEPWH